MSDDIKEPRVEDVSRGGWDALDQVDKKLSSAPKIEPDELRRIAGVAASLFSTDAGRQVLEWLLDQTVRRGSVPDVGVDCILMRPEAMASYVLWNEAQKALVLRLITLIEAGKKAPE